MQTKIVFNGTEYDTLDAMPPDVRRAFEQAMHGISSGFGDADGNGMPDGLEGGAPQISIMTSGAGQVEANGQMVSGLDQVPPEARQALQQVFNLFGDGNLNGVPDFAEGSLGGAVQAGGVHIVHDGQVYNSVDQLPPELQQKYQAAMARLGDANRDGVPDVLAGVMGGQAFSQMAGQPSTMTPATPVAAPMAVMGEPRLAPAARAISAINTEVGDSRLRTLGLIVALLLLAGAAVAGVLFVAWYFFSSR